MAKAKSKPAKNPAKVGGIPELAKFHIVPLDAIRLDGKNVRRHPDDNRAALESSLNEFGPARSIVLDADDVVRAGNGTVEAAHRAGITEVLIVDPTPGQMVAVRRKDWTPTQAMGYAIADNKIGEMAGWDEVGLGDQLRALQSEDFNLDAVGYDAGEVDALIEGLAARAEGGLGDPNPDDEGDPLDDDDDSGGEEADRPPAEPLVYSHEQVIEAAFAWYRANGYPYRDLPPWKCMDQINRLASAPDDSLVRTTTAYQVADTYHPHRFHASAAGMRSPFESFNNDNSLRKALALACEYSRDVATILWMVNGTQACANFRPGFACKLYREYCKPGAVVLDTSTGYGGRLVGFMASGIAGRYVGIDPNVPTHESNMRMAADLGFADRVELHKLPAEDMPHNVVAGRCDFAFTSPPFFCKEHYSDDDTQSWVRYKTGEAWRDGFLLPTLRLQFAALKPGAFSLMNVADVKVNNQVYPLAAWTVAMGEVAGFIHIRTDQYPLGKEMRFGSDSGGAAAIEPVIVFQKPES